MRTGAIVRGLRFWVCALQLGLMACSNATGEWVATYEGGFAAPESVIHDPQTDAYLVSNINGDAMATDGNGFISRIDPATGEIEYQWIGGQGSKIELNAPKGLAISGRRLIVADITVVRIFDLDSRLLLAQVPIDGSSFLNDVFAMPDGTIFVSDSGVESAPAVYRIEGENVTTVHKGAPLQSPNGLLHDGEMLWVADFGSKILRAISGSDTALAEIELPKGKLDGIARGSKGELYVSSTEGSSLFVVDPDRSVRTLARNLETPADIGFDSKRDRILVPLLNLDKVVALKDSKE